MQYYKFHKLYLPILGAFLSATSFAQEGEVVKQEGNTVTRDGLIITYQNDQTTFKVANNQQTTPEITNGYNALTALKLYISKNDIRHLGLTSYPVTYQFINSVYQALASCQQQLQVASNFQAVDTKTLSNLSLDKLNQVQEAMQQGNAQELYLALAELSKKLNVPGLEGYISQPCVVEQLSKAQPIDYKAFKAEQEKSPNVLQVIHAYYRSLFVNYYTPLAQKQQTPPLLFSNQGSNVLTDNANYTQYTNADLLKSSQSFTVTTGKFKTQVFGLGSKEQQEAAGDNLYAQVASNVFNAISTISEINADGSLRHLFTIMKLVNSAVQAYGFYDADVKVDRISEQEFKVSVVLGKPVRLTDTSQIIIRGSGSGLQSLYEIASKITPAGTIFKAQDYTEVKDELLSKAQEAGYLDAQYKVSQVLVNKEKALARWNLDLDTGSRYKINSIKVVGGPLDPRLTYYMTGLQVGNDYSETDVSRSIAYLQASRNFDTVDLSSEVNKENRTVDLTYNLTKGKPNNLELSAGYDTTEGVRTSAYYDRYYVNRWGGSIAANAYLSKLTQRVETYYRHPYLYSPLTKYFTVGFYLERAYQSSLLYYSRSAVGYFSYVRMPTNNWQFTSTLYLRKDLWQELGESSNQGLTYGEFIFARSGLTTDVSFTFRTTFGLEKLLSGNVSYNAFIMRLKHTFQLTEKNGLLLGFRYGVINSNNFNKVAPSLRFYSGGMNSIRGYGYQSISSYKGNEDIGANKQIEFTAEYLRTIVDNLKGAVFVDGGDSSDTVSVKNLKDWYYGAGIGVRYYLPVGYASFDIAYPLQPGFQWSKIAFYININASF
ncbi:autotransporter assembly complex protein TamA [Psittacicella gerlachiana]|uniref:Translocation and assembly module subunit TamA n=1 Tax=Psittacicella gerlachiana TaxID=2028574 RepID=A0A3A1YL09_9GAMM|nr:BamA/TamA family outer membrane protein [Psittacicella gerlachiana]RIY37928.1 hypothetical protein CKF59_01190 [Psittacicella gerlachiana]